MPVAPRKARSLPWLRVQIQQDMNASNAGDPMQLGVPLVRTNGLGSAWLRARAPRSVPQGGTGLPATLRLPNAQDQTLPAQHRVAIPQERDGRPSECMAAGAQMPCKSSTALRHAGSEKGNKHNNWAEPRHKTAHLPVVGKCEGIGASPAKRKARPKLCGTQSRAWPLRGRVAPASRCAPSCAGAWPPHSLRHMLRRAETGPSCRTS